ncbi:MAG: Zn-ribbon containing protein [Thermoplasmatota archaeon]
MPHQCLNCGSIIPRGSDQILKGCSDCGGKKFMYVETALPEKRRMELKKKADQVRDEILKKTDDDLFRMLKERGITSLDADMKEEIGTEWVRISSKDEETTVSSGSSRKGVEIVPPGEDRKSARDMIKRYDKDLKEKVPSVVKVEDEHEVILPREKPPRKTPRTRKKPKRGKRKKDAEVITIVEHGVYEINVEKLLDDNPIIIQKDGSYLIHLPSLFDLRKKNKKN